MLFDQSIAIKFTIRIVSIDKYKAYFLYSFAVTFFFF